MNKRWYDADPVIKNAINFINSRDEKDRNMMADFITEEAKKLGVEAKEEVFDCFWNKRQDENEKYITALEALKALEIETQREVAFKLLAKFKNTPQI